MECARDIEKYTTKVNSQQVYMFLVGLDSQLDGVRGWILATKQLSNIHAACIVVCAKANCQDATLGVFGEGNVMTSRKMPTLKKDRKCTHCNGTCHTLNTCFQVHGYPN